MTPEQRFKYVAYSEGISYLALFVVTMPLKYWAAMPGPNRVVGFAHGLLFVSYVVLICEALGAGRFTLRAAALAFLAALLPFGPFVFERWFERTRAD
jgi:integral membrane protein